MAQDGITIQQFILREMDSREMSMRKFAEFIDVSQSTVSRVLDEQQAPTLEFLIKLSKATKTRLGVLAEIAYPDATDYVDPTASSVAIAKMIEKLPDNVRDAVMAIIQSRVN